MDPAHNPFSQPVDTFSSNFDTAHFAESIEHGNYVQDDGGYGRYGTVSPPRHYSLGGHRPGSSSFDAGPVSYPTGMQHQPNAGLNPRSCVTCRRRKVKCDKRQPCGNCQKAHIDCMFPKPGRAPRRPKKQPDEELLKRLRRLEGVVQKLGKGEDGLSPEGQSPEYPKATSEEPGSERPTLGNVEEQRKRGQNEAGALKIEREMGKLHVGEGKSRYVSNTFWAQITEEVDEMKNILNYSSDESDEEDHATPESQDSALTSSRRTHQEFIFGYSSSMQSLRILHPPANEIMKYWDIFVDRVDPVVRLIHKPTTRELFVEASKDQSSLSRTAEALVFSIYFAAVVSLSPKECRELLGLDKEIGIKRFRFAAEQAFSRASFLSTKELVVVQAFTLFLACVRRQDDTKTVWTLTGLLTRMSISIGLHRDGTQFGLSPFQTEIRRRLWWQIITLDVRASEDQGVEPLIAQTFFDSRMPLNVNDTDIYPEMTEPPPQHEGCTEMTFDLVRYEIGGTIRALAASKLKMVPENQDVYASLGAKEALLEKLKQQLEDKYLKYCDMSEPLQWVAFIMCRLVLAKISLVIHFPDRQNDQEFELPAETREQNFLTSVDVIRYSRQLETQKKIMKWGWLFRTYFQWHALAFLLSELCNRTSGKGVDEAWEVLEEAFPDWSGKWSTHRKSILWKPITALFAKARRIRLKELERRQKFPSDGSLGPAVEASQQAQNLSAVGLIPGSEGSSPPTDSTSQGPYSLDQMSDLSGVHPSMSKVNAAGFGNPVAGRGGDAEMWVDDTFLAQDNAVDFSDLSWINSAGDSDQQMMLGDMPIGMRAGAMWGDGISGL